MAYCPKNGTVIARDRALVRRAGQSYQSVDHRAIRPAGTSIVRPFTAKETHDDVAVTQLQPAPARSCTAPRDTTRGPITRLVSPSDLGELIKPFVFLDLACFDGGPRDARWSTLWHPHSGIATVTVMLDGRVRIAETTGKRAACCRPAASSGCAPATASGTPARPSPAHVKAFQLWVALPPELENGPRRRATTSCPTTSPCMGPARVILGSYGGATSPIAAPPMTYLAVSLARRRALDLPAAAPATTSRGSPCADGALRDVGAHPRRRARDLRAVASSRSTSSPTVRRAS